MAKYKLLNFLLIFLFPLASYACHCGHEGIVNTFQKSEFVAKARILKITPDPTNADYHDAVIEIITLYKGTQLNNIKIMSVLKTSCRFLPMENSTWIIFAGRWEGRLSFGNCSGSYTIPDTQIEVKHSKVNSNYNNIKELREHVIAFLSTNKLFNPNPLLLTAYNPDIQSFNSYINKNSFAVFQVDVNTDLSIANVKQLKKFQNGKLNKFVLKSMKTNLKFYGNEKILNNPTRVILFCFFSQSNNHERNYISFFDV